MFESSRPLEIPFAHAPKPGNANEQEDASQALKLLLESEDFTTEELDFGVWTTGDFPIFSDPLVVPPPIEGVIMTGPSNTSYLPNMEGKVGDITVQDDLSAFEAPGIRIGIDAEVLVIAQRFRMGGNYAVTAALADVDVAQLASDDLASLQVRYGAY